MAIGLYRINGTKLTPLTPSSFSKEKDLQLLFEGNLHAVFGIRLLASEYSTGDKHGGRMDTLGIDETNAPVIIEYKRNENQNVINQALFYLDWLLDHKGDFELLVIKKLGSELKVDWSSPRVLCVAASFSKYDKYAVTQMGRPIELVQHRLFQDDVLMLDVVATGESKVAPGGAKAGKAAGQEGTSHLKAAPKEATEGIAGYDLDHHLAAGTEKTNKFFNELREYILGLGDDIVESPRKFYVAYRGIRNFACLEVHKNHVFCYLTLDPAAQEYTETPFRDVRKVGHFGTGDLEVRIQTDDDLEPAKEALLKAYKAHAI